MSTPSYNKKRNNYFKKWSELIWASPSTIKTAFFPFFNYIPIYIRFLKVFLCGFRGFSIWETRIRCYFWAPSYPWDTFYRKTSWYSYKKNSISYSNDLCVLQRKYFFLRSNSKNSFRFEFSMSENPRVQKISRFRDFLKFWKKIWTGVFLALTTKKSIFRPLELRILQK
jgi:hypothetical protein